MVQVQILSPLNAFTHKPRPSGFHCSPLSRRHTLPPISELAFSYSKRQIALERVAVRKFTAQVIASSRASQTKSTVLPTPSFVPAALASDITTHTTLSTPPTPLESASFPERTSKVDIFRKTTKSGELLDLTLAALDRIYIQDFCQDTSSMFDCKSQPMAETTCSSVDPSLNHYDLSPPSSCGSSVSSARSSPSSIPTTPSMSPDVVLGIASPSTVPAAVANSGSDKSSLKPVGRTQSLPIVHPVIEDKTSLRWFLTELLRRSRASATVVQLALHYLNQARVPVGKILATTFKSEPEARSGQDGKEGEVDSPLLDPRRLLLASLMLSTKILHDHAPNNRAWARLCGLGALDVGKCERALGQALNWELAHMFVGPIDQPLLE